MYATAQCPLEKSLYDSIHFVKTEFMLAYIRDRNTAHSVYEVFEKLYWLLFPDDFMKLFPVILGNNGTEFSDPLAIEIHIQEQLLETNTQLRYLSNYMENLF